MNERIKKLLPQLLQQADIYSYMEDGDFRRYNVVDARFALLVEVIVRQCANIAADQSAFKPEYRIRKHFGVEE